VKVDYQKLEESFGIDRINQILNSYLNAKNSNDIGKAILRKQID
jgi:hypothetical protein